MFISGFVKTSLIDYPGKISAVIFTQGCNFRCSFCHNPELVPITNNEIKKYSFEEVLDFLKKRKNILEGVVITGGEPLLYPQKIREFCQKIKGLNYPIKLDTNGTIPKALGGLIKSELIDYVAMDIKNSPERYKETIGVNFSLENIRENIKLIINSGLDYEFRTTVLPRIHSKKDFHNIGRLIKGAKKYYLQEFRQGKTLDEGFKYEKSFSKDELKKIKEVMENYVENCEIRARL